MRSQLKIQEQEFFQNPLDRVEDVLAAHNWTFNRMNDDELVVQVSGRSCDYRLFFLWQDDMSALQFCCQYDLAIKKDNVEAAGKALMDINENLWMGHFDIPADSLIPSFRQTSLFRGMGQDACTEEQIEDLVDISMAQCERHFSVFHVLSKDLRLSRKDLSLALMQTEGES